MRSVDWGCKRLQVAGVSAAVGPDRDRRRTMTYKVVQWGTGNMGSLAVQSVLKHPDLELIGTWVSSAEKAGRDVGELSRVSPIGVLATKDADMFIAGDADCIYIAANSLGREEGVLDDCIGMLRAGKNVVNVSDPALVYPKAK